MYSPETSKKQKTFWSLSHQFEAQSAIGPNRVRWGAPQLRLFAIEERRARTDGCDVCGTVNQSRCDAMAESMEAGQRNSKRNKRRTQLLFPQLVTKLFLNDSLFV